MKSESDRSALIFNFSQRLTTAFSNQFFGCLQYKKKGACPQNVRCDFLYFFILFHKRQLRRRWLDFLPLSSLNIKKGKKKKSSNQHSPLQSVSEKTHSVTQNFAKRNVFFYLFFFKNEFSARHNGRIEGTTGKISASPYSFGIFIRRVYALPPASHSA